MDDFSRGRGKEEWQDEETRTLDLQIQKQPQQQQGKIPGMIFKGVFLALAVAVFPLLHKQSPHFMSSYANHARSWELIIFVIIGLAVSCGVMSRRPGKGKDGNDDGGEGTQNYVQKMFEIAGVFDDFKTAASDEGVRDKLEMWSSRWQPEEPFVVIAGERKKDAREKPLLLPVRSLSSSLSNPDVFEGLDIAKIAQEGRKEVRNTHILSVESGNFEEEVEHVVTNGAPVVLPSPIPWASRPDVLTAKESHLPIQVPPPAPAADDLASVDEKIAPADDPPAIPSPIPWRSRPSDDAKQRSPTENPDVSEGKPPLVPQQRPPANNGVSVPPLPSPMPSPLPSPRAVPSSPSPRPSPRPSPSPPRPRSGGLSNGNPYKNLQTPSATPLQKLPSPRPSPSPPRPRNAVAENGSSQKREPPLQARPTTHNGPALSNTKETPTPPPPPPAPAAKENGFPGSSRKLHVNGDGVKHRSSTDLPNSSSPDETKSRKASVSASPPPPPPPPPPPLPFADFKDFPAENGLVYRSDSRSKSREGLSQRSVSNTKAREGSSNRSESRSKDRDRSSNRSDSRGKAREGSSNRSDSRSRSRDALFHSQHTSRDMETDSGSTRQKIRDGDASLRVEFEKSSRKSTSPHPPPPPFPHVMYSVEPKPDPIPPPSLSPKDEEPNDDLQSEKRTCSSAKVVFEVGSSKSESDSESLTDSTADEEDNSSSSSDEVDKKADEFIAKFHEQIRLQKVQSMRRSQRRLEKKSR